MEIPQPAPTLLDVRLQQEVGGPILPIFLLPICELLGHVLLHPFPRDLLAVRAREFVKEGLISSQPARFHQRCAHGQVGPAHGPAVRDGPQAMTDQEAEVPQDMEDRRRHGDRKSTRLNSSHLVISYAVFCLKKKKKKEW